MVRMKSSSKVIKKGFGLGSIHHICPFTCIHLLTDIPKHVTHTVQ